MTTAVNHFYYKHYSYTKSQRAYLGTRISRIDWIFYHIIIRMILYYMNLKLVINLYPYHFNTSSTKALYLVLGILFWLQWIWLYKCCQFSFGRKGRIIRACKIFSALMNIYCWRWHMKWAVIRYFHIQSKEIVHRKKCQVKARNRCLISDCSNHLSYIISTLGYID